MVDAAEDLADLYARSLGPSGAFLPERVPAARLPERLQPYLDACAELPLRYPDARGGVRSWLDEALPDWDADGDDALSGLEDFERDALTTALSALAHTWRWHSVPPRPERFRERTLTLPPALACPWRALARRLDVPMVGSMWSMHLCNWRSSTLPAGSTYDPAMLALDDLELSVQWLDAPYDQELRHFSLVFVLTEAEAAAAVGAAVRAIVAASDGDRVRVADELAALRTGIDAMRRPITAYLRPPYVEPAHWLDVIQPTMPWQAETEDVKRATPGPNGLQMGSLQCLDAVLGIHSRDGLGAEAVRARVHMPRPHRRFLAAVDAAAAVLPSFVASAGDSDLAWSFNDCLKALRSWRLVHRKRGARYLRASSGSHTRVSTGLGVPWRSDSDASAEALSIGAADPVAFFEDLMARRVRDTLAAMLPVGAREGEAPAAEDALALLTDGQRTRLLAVGEQRHYAKGDTLIEEGAGSQPLQLIETGEANVTVAGRRPQAFRVRPGELIGEVAFLDGGDASASVVAVDDIEAIVFTRDRVADLLRDDTELAAAFYRSLGAMAARRLRATLATGGLSGTRSSPAPSGSPPGRER